MKAAALACGCLASALLAAACDLPPSSFREVFDAGGMTSSDAGPGAPLAFTVVALPDTQFYAATYPSIFDAQTRWIVDNKQALGIAFVVHEGDVVDADVQAQWQVASEAIHRLDGVVPYFVTAGNHDYHDGCRDTMIDTYFPVAGFTVEPWFGGTFEPGKIENNYGIIPIGDGTAWLVMELEFGPRDEVLAWANSVVSQHADLPAIVVTHAYLYTDGTRYNAPTRPDQYFSPKNYGLTGTVNDGEGMWRTFISQHDNIKLVLSGHAIPLDPSLNPDATGRLTSLRLSGSRCHQILANYQTCPSAPCAQTMGGDGYLRVLHFDPAAHHLSVRTYSPYLDQYKTDEANQFDLPLD